MSRLSERLNGTAFTLTCLAIVVWVMSILPIDSDAEEISLAVLPLSVFLFIVYILNNIIMKRGCRMGLLLLSDAVFAAAGVCLYWFTTAFTPAMTGAKIFFAAAFAACTVLAACAAYKPVKATTVSGCFDWLAILLILHMLLRYLGLTLLNSVLPVLCAGVMALCMIALIKSRMELTGPAGKTVGNAGAGRLIIIVIVILLACVTLLIGAGASGALHGVSEGILSALKTALAAVLAALKWLYGQFYRFMLWLSQWFSTEEAADAGLDIAVATGGDYTAEYTEVQVPAWFYIVLALLAAAVFVFIFLKVRKIRLKRRISVSGAYEEPERSGGLRAALAARLEGLRARIAFNRRFRKQINTPAGMLIWCERRFKKKCPRLAGESGKAYLRRLSGDPSAQAASGELCCLAELTELFFYAPAETGHGNCAELAVRIRKLLKRPHVQKS